MKKQLTLLSVSLLILALLGGVLWFMFRDAPNGNPLGEDSSKAQNSQLSDSPQVLYKGDPKSITVVCSAQEYSIEKSADGFAVAECDSTLLDYPLLTQCFDALCNVTGELLVENPENILQYGLEIPQGKVVINYGRDSLSVELGNTLSDGGMYGRLSGNSAVYRLDSQVFELLLGGYQRFISTAVTTSPNLNAAANGTRILPDTVTFSGEKYDVPLALSRKKQSEFDTKYGLYSYVISSHNNREADSNATLSQLSALFELTADRVECYAPSKAELTKYGFDNPYETVSFSWQDSHKNTQLCTLKIALSDDGTAFIMRDAIPVIYAVSANSLPWLDMEYKDILSPLALVPYIDTLSTLTIQNSHDTVKYNISLEGENLTVTCDGKNVDVSLFKDMYQALVSLPGEQYTDEQPKSTAKELITITYGYPDGNFDRVSLIEHSPLSAYLCVNGSVDFFTNAKYGDIIMSNALSIIKGIAPQPLY
ncbi:MAG: DUF4340 domain-containing protein [Oscillospiraceae bacterium]